LDLLRDRGRSEEDRYTKEKELVNLRNVIFSFFERKKTKSSFLFSPQNSRFFFEFIENQISRTTNH
jgi:hypothetical protein